MIRAVQPGGRLREAAAVLLCQTGAPRAPYLVARRDDLPFFGGYWAFPGGVVEAEDAGLDVRLHPDVDPADARFVVAAARELFEETGVLCVRELVDAAELRGEPFLPALARRGLTLDCTRFVPACRIATPGFAPVRYDTMFFRVDAPETPVVDGGELVDGAFLDVGEALARWRRGEIPIVPPAVILLRLWDAAPDDVAFLRAARALTQEYARGKIQEVNFSPGVRKLSLLTETQPPADHTNAYLVGTDALYLVDPGATRAGEHARLFEALDGLPLAAVLLTHEHPDHVGAVPAVVERYRLPVWAHAETARALQGRIPVARTLADRDTIDLGASPDGRHGWRLEALFTPGHARGHLAFRESRYGAILAGDMVSTLSSIVVAPPDGHLGTYMHSLARLRALPRGTLYPAHGPAQRDSHAVLDRYAQHRAERQAKIVAALDRTPRDLDAILERAYDDAPPELRALARGALAAGLEKLCEEDVAVETARGWARR